MANLERMRIDKWLWAARFYKTRSLAVQAVERARIQVNQQNVKPAKEIKLGDEILIKQAHEQKTVIVMGLSAIRGPAPVAQTLYEETADSVRLRLENQEQRRLAYEPADSIRKGRPTKRERRDLDSFRHRW